MRKVLSVALAGAMVASMGASAFASTPEITEFSVANGLAVCAEDSNYNVNGNVMNRGTELKQEVEDIEILLYSKNFDVPKSYNHTVDDDGDSEFVVIDTDQLASWFWNGDSTTPDSWHALEHLLIENGIMIKAADAWAGATPTQVGGNDMSNLIGFEWTNSYSDAWDTLTTESILPLDTDAYTSPQYRNVVNFWLNTAWTTVDEDDYSEYIYLYGSDGEILTTNPGHGLVDRILTDSDIRDNNIRLHATVKTNEYNIIDSVTLDDGTITIEYAEWLHTTDSADYEIELMLSFDGDKAYDDTLIVKGTIENREIKVYDDQRNVDIDDGTVIDTVEFNEKVAIHVGAGVTIHTKLFKDKLYYGVALRQADEADDVVFAAYPDVDNVVNLYLDGINNTGDYITLSTDYAKYYVYDKDLNYLGMGDEVIQPVSSKLYLANKRLDVASESDVVEEPTTEQPPVNEAPIANNPTTGGDGVAANNINANPGTGR